MISQDVVQHGEQIAGWEYNCYPSSMLLQRGQDSRSFLHKITCKH